MRSGEDGGSAAGWRKLYDWPQDVAERRILRLIGVGKWVSALVLLGIGAAFLVDFVVTATGDYQMSRYGTTVVATVRDTAPYDRDGSQYLLVFTVDGRWDEQWASGIGRHQVNQTVSVVVDRQDHAHIALPYTGADQWILYGIQLSAAVFFTLVGLARTRMNVAAYRQHVWARYGRRPPEVVGR
ncbi:hypothetical protein BDK92_2091 [Micromonospora pisi]|uniref:DUF3592 domain-containing protein n=1 Tax=Micromonospora pisi TaxID=589240 RepID=A0A495JHH6_9ACTN|nr:hypothetical protein [Micromonospora pisi]RKR87792.1 hypothetical protein BDK92_2091 [Micromonospora pisi]